MRTMDFDYCKITAINNGSGKVTCEEDLMGYHYGALVSSEADYGVDMRAEVFLLDRNIKIQASTDDIGNILGEVWGCRVLVADFYEPSLTLRSGSLNLDNVQVYNCSQKFTWKSAVQWEGASRASSKVTNSVISSGKGMGMRIYNSANVVLEGNVIADFVSQGIWVQNSQSITIDNNWVHHVIPWADETPVIKVYPILPDFYLGGITATEMTSKIILRRNVVSGTWHHGIHFRPMECDETVVEGSTDFIFENNIAHSISGNGAIAENVENRCTEVKDFIGYKCTEATINLGGKSDVNRGTNLVSIDSVHGIAVHGGNNGNAELYDCTVYGENEDNMDCPPGSTCDHCFDTTGIVTIQPC